MSKVKQNIFANFSGKAWSALMSLAFIPLYIRFMGIESYGLVGLFVTLQTMFALLDMGLSTTLNRELARLSVLSGKAQEMRNMVRTVEVIYWGAAFFVGLTVVGLSSPIAHYWVKADRLLPSTVHQAVILMGGVMAFRWPLSLYSGGLMGLQRQVLLSCINAGTASLRGVGAVLILWKVSPTIQAFFTWQMFISISHTLLTAAFLWNSLPKTGHSSHFRKKLLLGVCRFAAGMTAISVMSVILMQTDKIILSRILTLEMFGYYTLAAVVANALYHFITPVFSALFPRFSQYVSLHDQMGLKDLYHKSCQFVSVMILPAAIVVSLFSSEILLLWTRNPLVAENAHRIVSLLIIGTALNGLMNLPYGLQLSYGWMKLEIFYDIIAIVVLVPMIFFLTIHYGAIGAAVAWIILNSASVLIVIHIMHSRLLKGEQWRWYFNDVGIPLLAALPIALLWRTCAPDEMSTYTILIYLAGASITTLVATAVATPYTRFLIAQRLIKSEVPNESKRDERRVPGRNNIGCGCGHR